MSVAIKAVVLKEEGIDKPGKEKIEVVVAGTP
jgi:hypothetical protein